jgi:TonB family protein
MKLQYATILLATLLWMPVLSAVAQDGDKDIQKRLDKEIKDRPLMLRNFYPGSDLRFDSDGRLLSGQAPGIWTIHGYFQPKKIEIAGKRITLKGKRLYWGYNDKADKETLHVSPDGTTIRVARTPEHDSYAKIKELLFKVFLTSKEPLEDYVPAWWQNLVRNKFKFKPIAKPGFNPSNAVSGNHSPSDKVTPPQLLHNQKPPYTEEARMSRLFGRVILHGILSKEGKMKVQEIVRAVGGGLDESAIKTCETWEFTPASRNGEPMEVAITVDVVFDAF